jgi:hypothetical protein
MDQQVEEDVAALAPEQARAQGDDREQHDQVDGHKSDADEQSVLQPRPQPERAREQKDRGDRHDEGPAAGAAHAGAHQSVDVAVEEPDDDGVSVAHVASVCRG